MRNLRNLFTRDHLLSLVVAPVIWAVHFLVCYIWVSLACAFALEGSGLVITIATVLALALLAYGALTNYRKWGATASRADPEDAQFAGAFFSLTAMMLCAISAVAVVWVAAPTAALRTCAA